MATVENPGFDFTVNIVGLYFKKNRTYTNPSHNDIILALTFVKNSDPTRYTSVRDALANIYNCQPYSQSSVQGIFFTDYEGANHPIEIILLAIKWLFIEQDIRYWNWSGRDMLWSGIKDI